MENECVAIIKCFLLEVSKMSLHNTHVWRYHGRTIPIIKLI